MHTLGVEFLNGISQKSAPRLQNVFVIDKMYSVPSPHFRFLKKNPPANKGISVHTLGIKFLNGISEKGVPRLQKVFVDYKMYS